MYFTDKNKCNYQDPYLDPVSHLFLEEHMVATFKTIIWIYVLCWIFSRFINGCPFSFQI